MSKSTIIHFSNIFTIHHPKSVLIRAKPGKTALPFKSVLIPKFLRHIRFRRDYYNPV